MDAELISLFQEHRKKALIPCAECCFCWDIENFINKCESLLEQEYAQFSEDNWIDDYLNR